MSLINANDTPWSLLTLRLAGVYVQWFTLN